MLSFIGDYAQWCYSRNNIDWFAAVHDNLLFRFVFAPFFETVMFLAPFLIVLGVLLLLVDKYAPARRN